MSFPSVKEVAAALRNVQTDLSDECVVWLQVTDDGWALHADEPPNYEGALGCITIPGLNAYGNRAQFDSHGGAAVLVEQVRGRRR